MSYGLTNLESGESRDIGIFVLLTCIGWKRDTNWGKYLLVHVNIVWDTDIRWGCRATITTQGWRRYSFRHTILGIIETVGFYGSLRF